jgi:HK97 family phage major capsid protein
LRTTSVRQRLTDLREQRAASHRAMQEISERAEDNGRDLTADESKEYKRHGDEFDSLCQRIDRVEVEAGIEGQPRLSRQVALGGPDTPVTRAVSEKDAVLAPEQRFADWAAAQPEDSGSFSVADADDFCIGNIMRAIVDPRFRSELSEVETRALAEGVDATGGFVTPEPLSVNLIDKVRNQARVFEAGAITVPLDSDKQSIPRLSGDPTFAWRTENSPFAESQPAFERVTFTPQSGGFVVRTSEELFQDMVPGAGSIIENALTETAALELDRVALRGSGTSPEPRGVRNQSGVTIQSLGANGATPTRYTEVMTAITTLLGANRQPSGWMVAPRTSQFYAGLADTTNQPLNPPQPVGELSRFVTAQVPTNITQGTSTDTSEIYVGDWRDLLVGIRLGIQLRLLTERYADSGQYAWRVFLRADVQLAHPESFVVITGVRP